MKRNLDSFLKDHHSLTSNSTPSPKVNVKVPGPPAKVPKSKSKSKSSMVTTTFQLTSKEQQLRRLLLDVAKEIDESGKTPEPIVLRWAGGWVRDKLLDIQSHDIDVAINAMTGVTFAQAMCDYCERPEAMSKHSIGPADIGSLHNVARNPEKSKHLETAMVKMFGLDLDFVNLRKETYTEDSRNPQMEFGTAEEDARRRDATVNALFYNLHDDRVEDFTGGLADMEAKIIRTPLEPFQTFMDDPLRVLRLVRFASRLQFTIDASTRRYMADPEVLEALRAKISRERVGVELEKMLKGDHPFEALQLIHELQLFHAIFTDPTQENLPVPDISRWAVAYTCLDELLKDRDSTFIAGRLITSTDATYSAWNLAALSPWMTVEEPPHPRRKANALPLVAIVSREGFKAPNRLSSIVAASHRNRDEILKLKRAVCNGESYIQERDRFGMAIRKWDTPAGTWRLQVLNALLVEALETLTAWRQEESAEQSNFLAGWKSFLDHLAKLDVYEVTTLEKLLDGGKLAKALGGIKPGKWTGPALDKKYSGGEKSWGYLSILPEASYLKIRRSLFIFLLHQHSTNDNMPATGSDTVLGALEGLLGPSNTALLHDVSDHSELLTEAAVASLSILCSKYRITLDQVTLVKLTAVTDSQDPWTTAQAAAAASKLLLEHLEGESLNEFITNAVLEKHLKPLFMKSSSRITASGRPSQYDMVDDRSRPVIEVQSWRTQAPWAEATIQWTVNMSTTSLIKQHWPLFLPVLLALVESESTKTKARGLMTTREFMNRCPAQVLQNTGIGRVFADVTFPLLLYLPSVTPEDESTTILMPAYDVLIKLAQATGDTNSIERRRLFDKILRDGVFAGYFHASQHTRVVRVLLQKATAVISSLGIYTTKHLTPLLSMVSLVMTDPFAVSYPPTLMAATQTMSAIITNTWPRIQGTEHMENVARILSLCWLNVSEEIEHEASRTSADINTLSQELAHAARILQALWDQDASERPAKLSEALKQEPRLSTLFPKMLAEG
ncbi:CCA tRNA nucleotidyltransferase mitochondrial [Fusarium tjaetaba]|uniref:CCA tRNA nucleotidyltransferase mitochondrial n=1 Tax=Fusarium tjaetaba TaxID=1567544 RepID=A0A8H5VC97_9HYPO|nr:CCA tRNA nucleotidyltransferase mitochondrial [Fusarium tjaetaba]KAF5615964.1 CCA tRNA nucleotidyltransferase mitochondrial [Fusarium tjaetaba]